MNVSLQFLFAEPTKSQLMATWDLLASLPEGRALVDSPYEPHITVGLFTDLQVDSLASGISSVVHEPLQSSRLQP
jgi:hypothetical protein